MKVSEIILHHSATHDGAATNWSEIRFYHTALRGWKNVGYHYGLELIGNEYEILLGRFENENGAHCPGHNQTALGICLVGNFELNPIPPDQYQLVLKLVRQLMRNHHITIQKVYGHRELADTLCPGRYFDLDAFRRDL